MISYPLGLILRKAAASAGRIIAMPVALAVIGCVAAGFYVADSLDDMRTDGVSEEPEPLLETIPPLMG